MLARCFGWVRDIGFSGAEERTLEKPINRRGGGAQGSWMIRETSSETRSSMPCYTFVSPVHLLKRGHILSLLCERRGSARLLFSDWETSPRVGLLAFFSLNSIDNGSLMRNPCFSNVCVFVRCHRRRRMDGGLRVIFSPFTSIHPSEAPSCCGGRAPFEVHTKATAQHNNTNQGEPS